MRKPGRGKLAWPSNHFDPDGYAVDSLGKPPGARGKSSESRLYGVIARALQSGEMGQNNIEAYQPKPRLMKLGPMDTTAI